MADPSTNKCQGTRFSMQNHESSSVRAFRVLGNLGTSCLNQALGTSFGMGARGFDVKTAYPNDFTLDFMTP